MKPQWPLRHLLALMLSCGALPSLSMSATATPQVIAMAAPALPLARSYSDKVDPAAYLVSEKLDGVRAAWDGKTLRFRSGRLIHAPAWFTADFPAHAMDGELWIGRHQFDAVSAAVRRIEADDDEWKNISYQVYELPGGPGSFRDRLATLQVDLAQANVPWLQLLAQTAVPDRPALQAKLDQIVANGGEGLVLHHADAPWQIGRSDVLLKLKPQHDAEATVIGHVAGKGKYRGMLGALLVQTPQGKRFRLGTGLSDAERQSPPPVGSVITYRYRDQTSTGLPKFASYLRVRESE